jgi:hypothetical protein
MEISEQEHQLEVRKTLNSIEKKVGQIYGWVVFVGSMVFLAAGTYLLHAFS